MYGGVLWLRSLRSVKLNWMVALVFFFPCLEEFVIRDTDCVPIFFPILEFLLSLDSDVGFFWTFIGYKNPRARLFVTTHLRIRKTSRW